jgi:hypothetical protein
MANILTTPGLLDLDTAAVISATNKYKIRLVALVPAAAAATAVLEDGAGREICRMSANANGIADARVFVNPAYSCTGLELATITGAGARLQVYCA